VLVSLAVMKLAATVFSYSSGGAGGIFAPALFIGGMVGGAVGYLDVGLFHHAPTEAGAFALVGMGAVFAGIVRAPITSVLIIFEMTGSYDLILPLMLSNMVAYVIARRWRPAPIYDALLEQDGVELPHRPGRISHALEQLRVGEIMSTKLITLPADLAMDKAAEKVGQLSYSSFPVLDADCRLLGMISQSRLRRVVAGDEAGHCLGEMVDRRPPLYPDQPLVDAVVVMEQWEARQLAVVDRDDTDHLVGIITMSDIVRAQAQAALESGHPGPNQLSEVSQTLKA